MRIIWPNLATLSYYSSQHDEFKAEYVLSDSMKQTWRPLEADPSPQIVMSISGGGNNICLYNIDADAATVTIKDSGGSTVKTETYDLTVEGTYDDYRISRIWMDYPQQAGTHTAVIDLTGTSPEIGIIRAGDVRASFVDPMFGFSWQPKNYSIEIYLEDGYEYAQARNEKRVHPMQLKIRGEDMEQYFAFLRLAEDIGVSPFCMLIRDDDTDQRHEWIMYGKIPGKNRPRGSMPKNRTGIINFTIEEFF